MTYAEKVEDFLAQSTLAVAGVSENPTGSVANGIFRKLKDAQYTVFATNPHADQVEGVTCYHALQEIPQHVDGVVAVVPPGKMASVVQECKEAGIKRLWMHRSIGPGSVSTEAAEAAEKEGITVLAGGCPMMFCEPVDFPHKCIRLVSRWTGNLPKG